MLTIIQLTTSGNVKFIAKITYTSRITQQEKEEKVIQLQKAKIIIVMIEVFIQDVHFSITYIVINLYPDKMK